MRSMSGAAARTGKKKENEDNIYMESNIRRSMLKGTAKIGVNGQLRIT